MAVDVEKIVRDYLPKVLHMSMATVSDNRPWVCEVHFVYDEGLNLYFRSLASRRHSQEIAANPNVAGSIVWQHQITDYPTGIYFEGTAQLLGHDAERQVVFPLFQERLKSGDESILEEARREDGHQFYKVSVETWYAFGKFDGKSGQKYSLPWKNKTS